MKLATKIIHAGAEPDPSTGAIMTPIYQTSTYVQQAPGVNKGYEYARSQNPTRKALEDAYAIIENAKYALAFSSGVAATDSIIKLLNPGDEVIAASDMYGGSYRLFTKVWERYNIKFIYVDTTNAANVKAAVTASTKLIWVETPTNPLMNITDIEAIASVAKQVAILAVMPVVSLVLGFGSREHRTSCIERPEAAGMWKSSWPHDRRAPRPAQSANSEPSLRKNRSLEPGLTKIRDALRPERLAPFRGRC